MMAVVIVYEYPDGTDVQEAIHAGLTGKPLPEGARIHAAIAESADKVLAVFQTGASHERAET